MFYTVHLVIQQDKFLRLISDQEKNVRCYLKDEDFLVKSRALVKTLKSELRGGQISHRVGRMRDAGWSKELEGKQLEEELNEALSAARAWMEIVSDQAEDRSSETLQVGETATLTVKSTLPAGIGWRVVDCLAHDGLGDSSQKLLDEQGCPIDEFLMPELTYGPIRPIALMRHQEAVSRFPAFKFPDRDRLHLSCGLQLCKGPCKKVICNNGNPHENRTSRTFIDASDGDILDRLEVFNSVEVFAPEIDDLGDRPQTNDPELYPFTNIPGDRTFCVSPDKMAIAFCILGFIFLIAVIVAVCSLLKSKRYGSNVPYYSRSLFSSSSTSGSAFGSRLLLHDSPCTAQGASTSRRMQYGRIL
ncbi:cypher isoform X2 [Leptinotarsa decemlineata]